MLEKFFHLKENHTDVKTEIMAGITTFMTMAYILAVNPNILSAAGMDSKAVLIATALASFIATALMAVLANYPFALAPGMGLNAYFAYTVVLTMGYSWQLALMAVFVEGVIFIALSLTNVREGIFIPFIQNGIEYYPNGRATPKQVLHVNKKSYGRGKRLTPTITAEMRERMIQAGVISPSDKKAVGHVGFIVSDYGYERIFDDEKKG